jgi:benzylsuccinate CoA-transferase BbsF subunit
MFSVINRNKRSCTLNIASPEGQQLLRDLVAESDVLVENFSGGVLRKYGLAYEHLQPINPDLVFVSASGLGRTGPQRDALAYGSLLQGYSGRVSMIGKLNPALEAMGILPAWTDPITAMWEVFAILAALRHRTRTGEGAYVDLSMLESTVALLPRALLRAALEEAGIACESVDGDAAPSGCFRCAGDDEWLAVSVRTDVQWRALCAAIGASDLALDRELVHHDGRLLAKATLDDHLARWLRVRPAGEAERLLQRHGVPAARSRDIGELVHDEHLKQRGVFRPWNGEVEMGPLPWLEGEGGRGRSSPAPAIGGDNEYVFGELLGLSRARQQELQEMGVIR